jgi:hypothetical protein
VRRVHAIIDLKKKPGMLFDAPGRRMFKTRQVEFIISTYLVQARAIHTLPFPWVMAETQEGYKTQGSSASRVRVSSPTGAKSTLSYYIETQA